MRPYTKPHGRVSAFISKIRSRSHLNYYFQREGSAQEKKIEEKKREKYSPDGFRYFYSAAVKGLFQADLKGFKKKFHVAEGGGKRRKRCMDLTIQTHALSLPAQLQLCGSLGNRGAVTDVTRGNVPLIAGMKVAPQEERRKEGGRRDGREGGRQRRDGRGPAQSTE